MCSARPNRSTNPAAASSAAISVALWATVTADTKITGVGGDRGVGKRASVAPHGSDGTGSDHHGRQADRPCGRAGTGGAGRGPGVVLPRVARRGGTDGRGG